VHLTVSGIAAVRDEPFSDDATLNGGMCGKE
jgi:hypothetical protein